MKTEELQQKIEEFNFNHGVNVEIEFHKCITVKLIDRDSEKLIAFTGMLRLESVAHALDIYPTAWEVLDNRK